MAQFGEPASKNDYHRAGTDELMASVWQYHYINTDLEGAFYQTTELDFVGDNVVMVVFMNHDGMTKGRLGFPVLLPCHAMH